MDLDCFNTDARDMDMLANDYIFKQANAPVLVCKVPQTTCKCQPEWRWEFDDDVFTQFCGEDGGGDAYHTKHASPAYDIDPRSLTFNGSSRPRQRLKKRSHSHEVEEGNTDNDISIISSIKRMKGPGFIVKGAEIAAFFKLMGMPLYLFFFVKCILRLL